MWLSLPNYHFIFILMYFTKREGRVAIRASPENCACTSCLLLFSRSVMHDSFCDPIDCSMPGLFVLRYLLKFAQIHVHQVGDALYPSCPLLPPSPFAFNLSQHQGLFQWFAACIRWPKYWSFNFSISSLEGTDIQGWFPLVLTGLISSKLKR